MATTVQNPFDTQQASPTNTGIVGGAVQNMTTGAPGQTPYQQYNPTPGVQAQTYTAQTREVNKPTETVVGQVDSILAKDSPLMQRARTLATQQMAQRGLVNTSMNAGAGVAAMTDRALPMAQQDAQTYGNRALANMDAVNQSNQFNVGQTNDMFKFGQDVASRYGLQTEQQKFQAGENKTQRDFQAEQSGMDRTQQTELQQNQFAFQGTQAEQDRAQQIMLADKNITAQQALQLAQQEFQSAESVQDRAQQIMLADKNITAQQALQLAQQEFQGTQATLDREQQSSLQKGQQEFTAGQNQIQNTFTERMTTLEQSGLDSRQAREIASREAITQLEQAGINNRFDQELAIKSDMFNVEQINAERKQIIDNDAAMERLGLQINANKAEVPSNFAGNISTTTLNAVNEILNNKDLKADAKKSAIDNVVAYANSQLQWGSAFYNTPMPTLYAPGAGPAAPAAAAAPAPAAAAAPAPAAGPALISPDNYEYYNAMNQA